MNASTQATRRPVSETLRAAARKNATAGGKAAGFGNALLGPGRRGHTAHQLPTGLTIVARVPLARLSIDHSRRLAALALIMLPDLLAADASFGKHADTAIPEMLRLLGGLDGGGTA